MRIVYFLLIISVISLSTSGCISENDEKGSNEDVSEPEDKPPFKKATERDVQVNIHTHTNIQNISNILIKINVTIINIANESIRVDKNVKIFTIFNLWSPTNNKYSQPHQNITIQPEYLDLNCTESFQFQLNIEEDSFTKFPWKEKGFYRLQAFTFYGKSNSLWIKVD